MASGAIRGNDLDARNIKKNNKARLWADMG